ncbi:MAG: pteridine reductase [Cellvibrionales bacterium]|jgi:pteridine reductase|nr:pteridine reductase [Cellvibrionales bacterium]TXH48760.1 MAG: pteridine reductase [Cellvibrionales bacterium]
MNTETSNPVALITGAAQRIGAVIAELLHSAGYNIVIHYRHSAEKAHALTSTLNQQRTASAVCFAADLQDTPTLQHLAQQAEARWGRLDALINNASAFHPTPIGKTTEQDWDALIDSNMKAPFFLAQSLAPTLKKHAGCIINIADIYAEKPLSSHTVYCMAKAGNVMLTQSLAVELAPQVRVNGIAPGAILWPETHSDSHKATQEKILASIPLQRTGNADDIARTVLFLLRDAPYITGQILRVDGGRSLQF